MSNKIVVIGHGFVGKAVSFSVKTTLINDILVVDPAHSELRIKDLPDASDVAAVFVCVPTPIKASGHVDSSIAERVAWDLSERYPDPEDRPLVVVKSTLTPHALGRLQLALPDLVFSPEFLTERNAVRDFMYPSFHVIGTGDSTKAEALLRVYREMTLVDVDVPVHVVSVETASMIKYGINSFLATKVAFFNELNRIVEATPGADWESVRLAMGAEPRIGHSHTQVPGPDGKRGFGGSCFIKDTAALVAYAGNLGRVRMSNLEAVVRKNAHVRLKQGVDERELAQGITPEVLEAIIEFYPGKEYP